MPLLPAKRHNLHIQSSTYGCLMPDRLVTVAVFSTSFEAQMAKNLLASNGITACVTEENAAAMLGMVGNPLAGAKLLVDESDALRAELILESVHDEPALDTGMEDAPEQSDEISTTRTCPRCGRPFSREFDECPSCAPSEEYFEDIPDRPKSNLAPLGPSDDVVATPYSQGDEYASRALVVAVLMMMIVNGGLLASFWIFAGAMVGALGELSFPLLILGAIALVVCEVGPHLYVFYLVARFYFYAGETRPTSEYKAIAAAFISGGVLLFGLVLALSGARRF